MRLGFVFIVTVALCAGAHGEAKMTTIPSDRYNRGEVEEKKDARGTFIIVKSVVEYQLDVTGVRQLAMEVQAAGDASLQVWVDGKMHDKDALSIPSSGVGENEEPLWIRVAPPIDAPAGAQRIALVLRCDDSGGLGSAPPRRIYQLRFQTTEGASAVKLASAARAPWDYASWLIERYPLSDTIQESPSLRPRDPFRFDQALPEHVTDYPDAISSDEVGYQAGNQFLRPGTVRRGQLKPSLGDFVFGPAPTPLADKEKLAHRSYLTGSIGDMELRDADGKPIELKGAGLHFQPHHLETAYAAPGVQVRVDSAIDFTDMLEARIALTADRPVVLSLSGSFSLPGKWWRESGMWLGQTVFHYLLGLDVSADVEVKVVGTEKPIGYRIELAPSTKAELIVRLKPGYRVGDVREALLSQRKSSLSVAERSRQQFRDFFARVVPPFSCSDRRLVDIYYYIAYTVRLNTVDVPFEPYPHPYLTYSKPRFGGINMWSENVATDMLHLRWLNDKPFAERILRKALFHRDSPPLQPIPAGFRESYAWDYRNALTAYEFTKTSGNPEICDLGRKVVRATAERPPEHPLENGALDAHDHMVPQYDFSLRYKPFTKGRVWWGSRMDQPLAHIEVNFWRHQLCRMVAAFARAAGDPSAPQWEERARAIREAVNRVMWDDAVGFYFDYAAKDGRRSDVMSVAAFSALWAGVPDRDKADRLVAHLTNPKEFWSRFVVPGTSLADPRTNPRGYTDGGILLDVNNWFPFQGLLKVGRRDVAVELFRRTIDLMSARGIESWACDNFTADDGTLMGAVCPDAGVAVDMILRCTTGFVPRTDDLLELDPLVLGPDLQSMDWGPYLYKKHWLHVHWRAAGGDPRFPAGLTVVVDDARFHAAEPGHILLRLENGSLKSMPLIADPMEVKPDGE